jgi:hypothetical protein
MREPKVAGFYAAAWQDFAPPLTRNRGIHSLRSLRGLELNVRMTCF